MTGYTKLFGSLIASTIWDEDDQTRIVWITMLAMADQHGVVQASIPGLAKFAKVSIEAVEVALGKFLAADKYSRSREFDGRRIEIIDGGWFILNHGKYRDKATEDERREQNRLRSKRFRDRHAGVTDRNATQRSVTHGRNKQRHTQRQKKQGVFFPPVLDVPEFHAAWVEWEQHRREIKKKLTPLAIRNQLKDLAAEGLPAAIRMIERSITNGWTGLFKPDPERDRGRRPPSRNAGTANEGRESQYDGVGKI